ncbi:unnamed protein product [Thelazia callipaeda]|uniref:CUE domain-containing protein n=1 Tax=Thelazia callipaeda TaxID=103827 RepID=A0A0N5CPJ1_THECL|nr:unnamed protein product [Thelazia callipaeda]
MDPRSETFQADTGSKRITAAERRKKVFLGELPDDFLRIAAPSHLLSGNHPQSAAPAHAVDPSSIAHHNFIQSQHAFYSFVPPNTRGRLSITLVEAKLVKNYSLVRMDPYCRIHIGNYVLETSTDASGGKTPKWNRIINTYLPHGVESFYLQIFDEKAFTVDECIAWSHIVLPNGIFNGEIIDDWYQLSGQQGEGKEGIINIIISFTPINKPETPSNMTSKAQYQGDKIQKKQQQQQGEVLYTEEDSKELHAMFPSVEIDVIKCILEEKRGNKNAAVSAILEITAQQ